MFVAEAVAAAFLAPASLPGTAVPTTHAQQPHQVDPLAAAAAAAANLVCSPLSPLALPRCKDRTTTQDRRRASRLMNARTKLVRA